MDRLYTFLNTPSKPVVLGTNHKIIKNDRVGYGYNDSNLKCTNCNCVTTRYIKIGYEILCSSCLDDFIQEMRKSLLEDL